MRGWTIVALTLAACCPSRPAEQSSVTSPAKVSNEPLPVGAAPKVDPPRTTFSFRGKTFTLGEDQPFPACEHPELWLTFVRPEEFTPLYCGQCGTSTWCNDDPGDESGGPWSFAQPSREPTDGFWCNELRYVRHAIGAELGVAVPLGRYARYFGDQRWYSPQPALTEADLPSAARENIAWLGAQLDHCDEGASKLAPEDQRLVDDWFDANYAGRVTLPKNLYDNCQRIGAGEFRTRIQSQSYLGYSARTPVVRLDDVGCSDIVVPAGGRVIAVHVGAWLTAERCTECEGHEILEMVVDKKGRVVALVSVLSG